MHCVVCLHYFHVITVGMHYTHNSDCAERWNAQYRLLCVSPGVVLNMQGLWENKKPKLTAGGSSGGTAAALAAGQVNPHCKEEHA